MKLVCFLPPDDVARFAEETAGKPVQYCVNIDEISFEEQRDSVFVLAYPDSRSVSRLVHILRQDPRTSLQPLYTTEGFGKPLDLLVDGVVTDVAAAATEAEPILRRLAELDDAVFHVDVGDYLRILALLYSRPDRQLVPHRVWLDEHAYAYTLLEAMLGSAHLVASRLAILCDWRYLQRRQLIDRTSHCPVCSSLQLNLVDHCPQCKGTIIEEVPFMQCLLCGHVAEKPSSAEEGFMCPQCKAMLQQIKTDYDWVQGNFNCRSCGNSFTQPDPQAHCLRCGSQAPVGRLLVRQIYSYELTGAGIDALKSGLTIEPADVLNETNVVASHFFTNMINWLLDFCGRDSCEVFTLIGIRLQFAGQVDAEANRARMELLDTFVYRISEKIRNVDLLSRFRQDLLWLLLPKTGKPDYQVVLDRIIALQQEHRGFEGEGLQFHTVLFHAPEEIVSGETSSLLLCRLEKCIMASTGLNQDGMQPCSPV
ncbi:MAG: hypothetical protein GX087_04780 [Desulfobulbaceae bacterium]|nr:hypothetical protein [Desulfobulbaceae bacterium]